MSEKKGKVYFTRRATFSASHRLHSSKLSHEENKKVFGKCNHPNGHGHNYVVKVTVGGMVDEMTGMVINLEILKEVIQKTIMEKMDHKCLDKDIDYFKDHTSTVENIAIYIWNLIRPHLSKEKYALEKVKVYETENNHAVYKG